MLPDRLQGKKFAVYGLARETTAFIKLVSADHTPLDYDLLNDTELDIPASLACKPRHVYLGSEITQ
ncbi:MAG: hypothetical protein KDD62_08470, partial [Bdellovibrionales bacterium]|nr:hypothetical protein [Bdellovibrionales bacterium]